MNTPVHHENYHPGRIAADKVVVVRPSPLRSNKENTNITYKTETALPKDVGFVLIDRHEGRENKKRSRATSNTSSSYEACLPETQKEIPVTSVLSEQKAPNSQLHWNDAYSPMHTSAQNYQTVYSASQPHQYKQHSPIVASTYHPAASPVPTQFHHSMQTHHPHQQYVQQPQYTQNTGSVQVQQHFSVAHQKPTKDQTLPTTGTQYQSFESPASKLNQLHQSSVQLDTRMPSEFNTYNSVEMKRDFYKGMHTDSQDALGSEGKIVIHSRSPSISHKGQLADTLYLTQHQQSRESTISRVASVQDDPNNMRRSSGTANTTNNNSSRFDRFSQGQMGHKDMSASMAQSMNVSSRGHNIISHYNTAGSSYGNPRMHEDPKNQALLVKIQELRDTNEMKDSQILLLHRENAILKDNIELLKRKVHVVSTDLKQKSGVLKQKDTEIRHLTDNLTHLTNKQFTMSEACTQTDPLTPDGLGPPDERNCSFYLYP